MIDENLILHFIRNMNALEQDHAPRYDVRGRGDNYSVWDTYLCKRCPTWSTPRMSRTT